MNTAQTTAKTSLETPLGTIILAANKTSLIGVWFEGQKHFPDTSAWPIDASHPVLTRAAQQLQDYFAGKRKTFDLPLDLSGGTDFQQSVWQALLKIENGTTASYGQISQAIGNEQAARAVGAAVGRNPLSIVVPCHRVMGTDGALTGYAGGLERKTALLKLEGVL